MYGLHTVDNEFTFYDQFDHTKEPFAGVCARERKLADSKDGMRAIQAEQAARDEARSAPYGDLVDLNAEPAQIRPWHGTLEHTVPTNPPPVDSSLPDESALQLEWIHGYHASGTRNAASYTVFGDIVFPAACVGVVMSAERHEQRFMMSHTAQVREAQNHAAVAACSCGSLNQTNAFSIYFTSAISVCPH